MTFCRQLLDLIKIGQADNFMIQRLKNRDIDDLLQMIEFVAYPDNNEKDRQIMVLQALNFLRPKNIEDRVKIFDLYSQCDKTVRKNHMQVISSVINDIPHVDRLQACLFECDIYIINNGKRIGQPLFKEYIVQYLENPTKQKLTAIKALTDAGLNTNQQIIQKVKQFIDRIIEISKSEEFFDIGMKILRNIAKTATAQAERIIQAVIDNMQICADKNLTKSIDSCIQCLINIFKVKPNLIQNLNSQILDVMSKFFEAYIQEQSHELSVVVINILFYFRETDTCCYSLNEFYMRQCLFDLFQTDNSNFPDLARELFECTEQFCKHYYIRSHREDASEDDKFTGFNSVFLKYSQSNPQLLFAAAIQPLWRHTQSVENLQAINNGILEYFSPVIEANDVSVRPYSEIIQFCQYLINYVTYTTSEEFCSNEAPIFKMLLLFTDNIEGFGEEYYLFVQAYVYKLYVCKHAQFGERIGQLIETIFIQVTKVVSTNTDMQLVGKILTYFSQLNVYKPLFQIKSSIYLQDLNEFSKEYLTYHNGDIESRQAYNQRLNQDIVIIEEEYAVNQSIQVVSKVGENVFQLVGTLVEKNQTKQSQILVFLSQIMMNQLFTCLLQLANEGIKVEVFDNQKVQVVSLQTLLESTIPQLLEFFVAFTPTSEEWPYEESCMNTIECISCLSQICFKNGVNVLNYLQNPIFLEFCAEAFKNPDKSIFHHVCIFYSAALPFFEPEFQQQLYNAAFELLNNSEIALMTEAKTALMFIISQYLTFISATVVTDEMTEIFKISMNITKILEQSPISTANDEMCSALLNVMAAALMKFKTNGQLYQEKEMVPNIDKIFDNLIHYICQSDSEKFFNLQRIELQFLQFIGLFGSIEASPTCLTIVQKPHLNKLIKKNISILSGIEDDVAKKILQGFMADYNYILQGLNVKK